MIYHGVIFEGTEGLSLPWKWAMVRRHQPHIIGALFEEWPPKIVWEVDEGLSVECGTGRVLVRGLKDVSRSLQ